MVGLWRPYVHLHFGGVLGDGSRDVAMDKYVLHDQVNYGSDLDIPRRVGSSIILWSRARGLTTLVAPTHLFLELLNF